MLVFFPQCFQKKSGLCGKELTSLFIDFVSKPTSRNMGNVDDAAVFDLYTYEGSKNVQVAQGYLTMFAGFVFFEVVNGLAITFGPPRRLKSDVWKWRNTLVSWIHADVVGGGVIYW